LIADIVLAVEDKKKTEERVTAPLACSLRSRSETGFKELRNKITLEEKELLNNGAKRLKEELNRVENRKKKHKYKPLYPLFFVLKCL
jgi:hypothetical protein